MPHLYICPNPTSGIAVIQLSETVEANEALTKTLFELSRTTDMTTHFNPAVHTREAIAAGIAGHRALTIVGECDDTDLPTDRYFRNAWEWSD